MKRSRTVLWEQIAPLSSRAHLIVAVLAPSSAEVSDNPVATSFGDVRSAQMQLLRLYDKLQLAGEVALSVSRLQGRTDIRLAFGNGEDADRVAAAVGAADSSLYGGWASERSFVFDPATPALREVEAPRKPSRRRSSA